MFKIYPGMIFFSALIIVVLVGSELSAAGRPEPQSALARVLQKEGYLGHYPNGQDLRRGVSAYLWDHRLWLKTTDFQRQRDADALVCLLHEKGYPEFASQMKNELFRNWCRQTVQKP